MSLVMVCCRAKHYIRLPVELRAATAGCYQADLLLRCTPTHLVPPRGGDMGSGGRVGSGSGVGNEGGPGTRGRVGSGSGVWNEGGPGTRGRMGSEASDRNVVDRHGGTEADLSVQGETFLVHLVADIK